MRTHRVEALRGVDIAADTGLAGEVACGVKAEVLGGLAAHATPVEAVELVIVEVFNKAGGGVPVLAALGDAAESVVLVILLQARGQCRVGEAGFHEAVGSVVVGARLGEAVAEFDRRGALAGVLLVDAPEHLAAALQLREISPGVVTAVEYLGSVAAARLRRIMRRKRLLKRVVLLKNGNCLQMVRCLEHLRLKRQAGWGDYAFEY